jgi:hypothetical protein
MNEVTLMAYLSGVTHVVWKMDQKSGKFLGSRWIEMAAPNDTANAVAQDEKLHPFGRQIGISFQAPDGKDVSLHQAMQFNYNVMKDD